jgi:hypothetical protein
MAPDFGHRFEELLQQADHIESKKHPGNPTMGFGSTFYVDADAFLGWKMKVRNLIASVCGQDSNYFKGLIESETPTMMESNLSILKRLRAVVAAAKEDYEGGYLNKLKNLIQAEVFDTELEQASELLASGYVGAAAVVAGVVLETGLRQMCLDNNLPVGKLDKMNADLAKAGVYSRLVQKQVTALADIRNSAAHGKPDEFKKEDVSAMVRDVPRILTM